MLDYSFTYQELELFLLVVMRVATFVFTAPFFSMRNNPRNVRVLFSLFLSIILYSVIPHDPVRYDTLGEYSILVLKEVITGLLIGLIANLVTMIVNFAGHIADMETGLSMVTLLDPATRDSVTISGAYYNYMITLLLMLSGMHRYLVQALAETYILIPINGQVFHVDRLMSTFVEFMSDYVIIGFRICLPIFATMILLNSILGILAKVSPQMNMFAVGMQIKVLVGLGILFLTCSMLPDAANFIFEQMKRMIVMMVEAISA